MSRLRRDLPDDGAPDLGGVIRKGLGQVTGTSGASYVIKVDLGQERAFIFLLTRLEYEAWLKNRRRDAEIAEPAGDIFGPIGRRLRRHRSKPANSQR